MPIRMVEDPDDQDSRDINPDDGGGRRRSTGGGGGLPSMLLNMVFMFLPMLLRKPKVLLVLAALFAAFWFLGGKNLISGGANSSSLSTGATLDQAKYDKELVFASLANGYGNAMPDEVSLERYCPRRRNQGQQGSCVAWASAYGAHTIMQAKASGQNPDDITFSPSFLYNQIHLEGCQGAYIPNAIEKLSKVGSVPLDRFPYDPSDCETQPQQYLKQEANSFRIKGAERLSMDGDDYTVDVEAVRQCLAKGAPVVIGMMVGGSFMEQMQGRSVWNPTRSDFDMYGFGGHAMCVVGYDDNKEGGAFRLMNSWGTQWGENGFAWVKYKDFKTFVKEAYGMYPMGSAAPTTDKFAVKFGLVNAQTKQQIALTNRGGNVFGTVSALRKGTPFKVAFTNTLECHTYVFGQETDGSSYVLFPYTKKHSSYCGITGTRVFPKDFNMVPDETGSKDYMAIVVSKDPLDPEQVKQAINRSRAGNFQGKVAEALAGKTISNIRFTGDNSGIGFETVAPDNKVAFMVIEVDKF